MFLRVEGSSDTHDGEIVKVVFVIPASSVRSVCKVTLPSGKTAVCIGHGVDEFTVIADHGQTDSVFSILEKAFVKQFRVSGAELLDLGDYVLDKLKELGIPV